MAALSVDKSLLDQFWKLSDNKDANRIEAAIKILKYINFNQVKIWNFVGIDNPTRRLSSIKYI